MENVILDAPETPPGKIYTINSMWWTSIVGTPLATAYLLMKNDETLNREKNLNLIWGAAVGLIILGLILGGINFLPSVVSSVIPIIGMNLVAQAHQKQALDDFIARKGQAKSFLDTLIISLIFLAGFLVCIIMLFMLDYRLK